MDKSLSLNCGFPHTDCTFRPTESPDIWPYLSLFFGNLRDPDMTDVDPGSGNIRPQVHPLGRTTDPGQCGFEKLGKFRFLPGNAFRNRDALFIQQVLANLQAS